MKFFILASFLFVAAVSALPVEEAEKISEDLQPADDLKTSASSFGLGGFGGYVSYSKPYYGGYSGGYNRGYNGGYHGGYNGGYNGYSANIGYSGYGGYSGHGGHSGYGGSYYRPNYGGYNGGYSSGYSNGWAPSYGYKTYNNDW